MSICALVWGSSRKAQFVEKFDRVAELDVQRNSGSKSIDLAASSSTADRLSVAVSHVMSSFLTGEEGSMVVKQTFREMGWFLRSLLGPLEICVVYLFLGEFR